MVIENVYLVKPHHGGNLDRLAEGDTGTGGGQDFLQFHRMHSLSLSRSTASGLVLTRAYLYAVMEVLCPI